MAMDRLRNQIYLMIFNIAILCSTNGYAERLSAFQCQQNQSALSKIIVSLSARLSQEIKEENYFYSPLSISAALAMIYIGTRGTTKTQMTKALMYNMAGSNRCLDIKISEDFRDLIRNLENKNDAHSLLMANSVFIQQQFTVLSEYTSKLREYFNSNIQYLDFANEEMQSLNNINQWVSNQTNGHIKKLLNEPLDTMTVLVLMNVIYFKGTWEYPFEKHSTFNSFFYSKDSKSKITPFMLMQNQLNYYFDEQTNYTYLEMNYANKNISMLLILSQYGRDTPAINLSSEFLCSIRSHLKPENVMVILPKFRIEYRRELSKDMMKFGIDELFTERADLSGIRVQNDIHASLMIHKAVIEVDENGSEASAVSGVGIDSRRKPEDQKVFWADHSFLFYIIEKDLNTVLFAGRVANL